MKNEEFQPKRPDESLEDFMKRLHEAAVRVNSPMLRQPASAKPNFASAGQRKVDAQEPVASAGQRKVEPVASAGQRKTQPKKARSNGANAAKASHLAKRAARADSDAKLYAEIPAGPAARAIRQLSADLGLDYGQTIARVFAGENVK